MMGKPKSKKKSAIVGVSLFGVLYIVSGIGLVTVGTYAMLEEGIPSLVKTPLWVGGAVFVGGALTIGVPLCGRQTYMKSVVLLVLSGATFLLYVACTALLEFVEKEAIYQSARHDAATADGRLWRISFIIYLAYLVSCIVGLVSAFVGFVYIYCIMVAPIRRQQWEHPQPHQRNNQCTHTQIGFSGVEMQCHEPTDQLPKTAWIYRSQMVNSPPATTRPAVMGQDKKLNKAVMEELQHHNTFKEHQHMTGPTSSPGKPPPTPPLPPSLPPSPPHTRLSAKGSKKTDGHKQDGQRSSARSLEHYPIPRKYSMKGCQRRGHQPRHLQIVQGTTHSLHISSESTLDHHASDPGGHVDQSRRADGSEGHQNLEQSSRGEMDRNQTPEVHLAYQVAEMGRIQDGFDVKEDQAAIACSQDIKQPQCVCPYHPGVIIDHKDKQAIHVDWQQGGQGPHPQLPNPLVPQGYPSNLVGGQGIPQHTNNHANYPVMPTHHLEIASSRPKPVRHFQSEMGSRNQGDGLQDKQGMTPSYVSQQKEVPGHDFHNADDTNSYPMNPWQYQDSECMVDQDLRPQKHVLSTFQPKVALPNMPQASDEVFQRPLGIPVAAMRSEQSVDQLMAKAVDTNHAGSVDSDERITFKKDFHPVPARRLMGQSTSGTPQRPPLQCQGHSEMEEGIPNTSSLRGSQCGSVRTSLSDGDIPLRFQDPYRPGIDGENGSDTSKRSGHLAKVPDDVVDHLQPRLAPMSIQVDPLQECYLTSTRL